MNWHICHKRKLFFFVFICDISPYVFTQIVGGRSRWMQNLIPNPKSTHTAYFWQTPLPQKQEIPKKTWWWHPHHVFSGISCFWGSGVHQKYAVWVLVGCGIKFHIQWALPLGIWVKTQGDMLKIVNTNKKSSFFLSSSKINKYYFIILTIILSFSLGGPF